MKIKKGDKVMVMAGKERGRGGRVLRVLPRENKVVVEGINLLKRRTRPKRAGEKGQVVQMAYPLAVSKVMLKCERCERGVRVGYRLTAKEKVRICRRCAQDL